MPRPRRRPTYYMAITLHDGTVTAAIPIRKPSKQAMKQEGRRIDPDGIARGHASSGYQYGNVDDPERFRFLDIFATNLNTRRALRDLVLPGMAEVLKELKRLSGRLDGIEATLARTAAPGRP